MVSNDKLFARRPLQRFTLNVDQGRLYNNGDELPLRPKSTTLLVYLVRNAGRLLSKEELLDAVWPGVHVTEASLTQCIRDIRRVLDDTDQSLVRTISRRGYVFPGAEIETVSVDDADHSGRVEEMRDETPKATITVLPFVSYGDVRQEVFADGLTEDLITELSRTGELTVIARHSSFAYKGRTGDMRKIARELGVSHLVEGCARYTEDRVRINVQLVSGAGGNQVWVERFDRALEDVFSVQSDVATKVVESLLGRLIKPQNRNRPKDIFVLELCVRGRRLIGQSPEAAREAGVLLEQAIALDPAYADAYRWLALNRWTLWNHFYEAKQPLREQAVSLARRAVELDPRDAGCRWGHGHLLAHERLFEQSDAEFAKAVELDPNDADTWSMVAEHSLFAGRPEIALKQVRKAFRLNPFPASWYRWELGLAQFFLGDLLGCVETLSHKSTRRTLSRRVLAAALAQLGRLEEAALEARLFMTANPGLTISRWVKSQAVRKPGVIDTLIEGYRKAGLPL